jgi:peptidoglycan/xylan/chitin deacetylase (PgdA/CDA1 family)
MPVKQKKMRRDSNKNFIPFFIEHRLGRFRFYQCVFLLVLISACQTKNKVSEKGGIAISFDDHFINEWYNLRPLFQKYGAKVTFFVTAPDSLTLDEIKKLNRLRQDGHEIGFHGTVHGRSTEMMKVSGPQIYVDTELAPGLQHLRAAGFNPTSYAHPGGNHNERVDSALYANGFVILRDVAIANRKFRGIPLYSFAPKVMNAIFYSFNKETNVDALLIDSDCEVSDHEMADAIKKAKETDTALMLFSHEPLYGAPKNGEYGFDVAFLEKILKEAQGQKLKFYTMSELPKL